MTTITSNKLNFRYQEVYQYLSDQVRQLGEGEKLPSIRELMIRFHASQSTVDKAMNTLKQQGWLETQAGKGTFVTRPTKRIDALPAQIDLILFGYRKTYQVHSFHREFIEYFSRLLGSEHIALRTNTIAPEDSRAEALELIDQLNPQALVIWNLYDGEIANILKNKHIPYILLTPNWYTTLSNSFYIDNATMVRLWFEHLTELGHTRIAHLHGVCDRWYLRDMHERLRFYYEEIGRRGLIGDPELSIYGGFTPEEGYRATNKLFDSDKRFTAIIANDSVVSGVYRAITERGLVVGKDISVMGTDDLEWCCHLHPPLTSVRVSRRRIAERVLEKLRRYEEFEKELIPVTLKVRESTGAVPEDILK